MAGAKIQRAASDISAAEIQALTPEQMEELYLQLVNSGNDDAKQLANNWMAVWQSAQNRQDKEDAEREADEANDPVRMGGIIAGSSAAGALGRDVVQKGLPELWSGIGNLFGGGGSGAGNIATEALPESLSYGGQELFPGGVTGVGDTTLPAYSTDLSALGETAGSSSAASAGAADLGATTFGGMSYLNSALAAPAAINTAIQTWEAANKILRGERDLTLQEQAALALPTFGASFLYNPVFGSNGIFSSGKDKDQLDRDEVRSWLEDQGFTEDYQLKLPDGSTFDIGRDGGEPYYNVGYGTPGYDAFKDSYDAAGSDEEKQNVFSGYVNDSGFANSITGSDALLDALLPENFGDKQRSDFAGYLTNASGGSKDNMLGLYGQFGFGAEDNGRNRMAEGVWSRFKDPNSGMTPQERNARLAEIDRIYGVVNPNQGKGGKEEFGDAWIDE